MNYSGSRGIDYNFVPIPLDIMLNLHHLGTSARAVLIYLCLHIFRFRNPAVRLSQEEIMNGRKSKDGGRLDGGTALSRSTVQTAIKELREKGFITITINDNDPARIEYWYSINFTKDAHPTLAQADAHDAHVIEDAPVPTPGSVDDRGVTEIQAGGVPEIQAGGARISAIDHSKNLSRKKDIPPASGVWGLDKPAHAGGDEDDDDDDSAAKPSRRIFVAFEYRKGKKYKFTPSQQKRLEQTVSALDDSGAVLDMPSPADLFDTDPLFAKFVEFVINKQREYANSKETGKHPSKVNIIAHLRGYNRKDGWIWYSREYGYSRSSSEGPPVLDEGQI